VLTAVLWPCPQDFLRREMADAAAVYALRRVLGLIDAFIGFERFNMTRHSTADLCLAVARSHLKLRGLVAIREREVRKM
jgi:hypothetical protein